MIRINIRKAWVGLLIFSFFVGLSVCIQSPSEKDQQKRQELERQYTESFKERAKLQYGKRAKGKKIQAETTARYNTVLPIVYLGVGENLLGEVRVGRSSFEAKYLVDQDVIYTKSRMIRMRAIV